MKNNDTFRIKNLIESFEAAGIDALLISSWPNVTYMTGFRNTESWALIGPGMRYFITDSRYEEQARREAQGFKVLIRSHQSVTQMVAEIVKRHKIKYLGFEAEIVTYAFAEELRKNVVAARLVPARGLVEKLRLIKDAEEIKQLKRSVDIAVKGYHYIRKRIKPGMTEREAQADLEFYTKTLGSEKPAFDIIIAGGPRGSMPHYQTGAQKFKKGDTVLIDMGVVYGGYHSDLTRTFFLGTMSPLQKKIYDIVWDAQRAGIRAVRPGLPAAEVDAVCRSFIAKKGYADYFGHGTGHGVGLEIHEAPSVSSRSKTVLKPGMVITVEPGIYLPGQVGVRIEDMVLVTETGHEVLTRNLEPGQKS